MNGTVLLITTSILWAIVHSLTASHRAKEMAARLFGEAATARYYRLGYNLFSAVTFLPLLVLLVLLPDQPLYRIPAPWLYLALAGQAAAALAALVGVLQTGVWDFVGLAQLTRPAQPEQNRLTVHGLYRYVRHPLYTAGLVFLWLTPEMTVNRLVLWVILSLYFIIGAYFEERKLLREFGQQYAEYKARTPMLLPRFWVQK
jgi:protein-S-isoprenylcysteine O-methyltransferase Ste14